MPELPEVEAVRRTLAPVMVGARIVDVELRRKNLRRPFVKHFARRLAGATVSALERRGKFLVASLSTGDTLVMHLGMSGSFSIAPPVTPRRGRIEKQNRVAAPLAAPPDPHDHVVIRLSSGVVVTYNDPRRFGAMDLVSAGAMGGYRALAAMGPEPLSAAFDGAALARACAGRKTSIKAALLDQRVVAGVGNIYASEALHLAGISPRRRASVLATASGTPREAAHRLAAAIRTVLEQAIARKETVYRASRFSVYEREGESCPTPGCHGTIARIAQAGRSTYFCAACQR